MQTISLSDATVTHLRSAALLRGLNPDAYAEELLAISLAALRENNGMTAQKSYRAMELTGTTSIKRSADEVEEDISHQRDEWDQG